MLTHTTHLPHYGHVYDRLYAPRDRTGSYAHAKASCRVPGRGVCQFDGNIPAVFTEHVSLHTCQWVFSVCEAQAQRPSGTKRIGAYFIDAEPSQTHQKPGLRSRSRRPCSKGRKRVPFVVRGSVSEDM